MRGGTSPNVHFWYLLQCHFTLVEATSHVPLHVKIIFFTSHEKNPKIVMKQPRFHQYSTLWVTNEKGLIVLSIHSLIEIKETRAIVSRHSTHTFEVFTKCTTLTIMAIMALMPTLYYYIFAVFFLICTRWGLQMWNLISMGFGLKYSEVAIFIDLVHF